MTDYLVVQASAAMFSTIEPEGWTVCFGVYVAYQNGKPVTGLKIKSFGVWELTTIGEIDVALVTELSHDFPTSKMPGVYRLQTKDILGIQSPAPQQFVYSIRVGTTVKKVGYLGLTTVDVSYLGKAK